MGKSEQNEAEGYYFDQKSPFSYQPFKLRKYLPKVCGHFSRIKQYFMEYNKICYSFTAVYVIKQNYTVLNDIE